MKYLNWQKPENGHFKSFHFWAISNLHRMTGKKNDTYHENKTRSSPETLIHFMIYSAAGFLFFSTTFHRHMPPNFPFLNLLLWLVVVPSVIYVCKSFLNFSNFHSSFHPFLFQEQYFSMSLLLRDVEAAICCCVIIFVIIIPLVWHIFRRTQTVGSMSVSIITEEVIHFL